MLLQAPRPHVAVELEGTEIAGESPVAPLSLAGAKTPPTAPLLAMSLPDCREKASSRELEHMLPEG